MMGAGKTAVGQALARQLQVPFADSDAEIEQAANLSISEIFARDGEGFFREKEAQVITRLLEGRRGVLSVGGGAFLSPRNRDVISRLGVSVWLRATAEVLWPRVKRKDTRPLLMTPDPRGTLKRLVEERSPIYSLADIVIDTRADISATETARRVHEAIVQRSRRTRMSTIRVDLGARAYDVIVDHGLLGRSGEFLAPLLRRPRVAVVTDETVARLHLVSLLDSLAESCVATVSLTLPAGEATKSWEHLSRTVDWLLGQRIERQDVIVALGGGVIGDLIGFAAAILRRGVRFVQVPTTLLAQVNSSVGGKTGINSAHGKNLVGAFHQPSLVLADTAVLATLPRRDFLAGYGEVAKYGLLGDAGFFGALERDGPALATGNAALRAWAVERSVAAKARIVERDETEEADRALLNLGHTFAHALETATGYSERLLHGEAVAIGCVLAFDASARLGLCSQEDPVRVRTHFRTMGCRATLADIPGELPNAERLMSLMAQDKKSVAGRMRYVLARGIGEAFVASDVDSGAIRGTLHAALAER